MTALLPDKYVPIDHSILGLAASIMTQLGVNDTVSTLWDRVSGQQGVRTFDRFALALTLLFAAKIVDYDGGILRATPRLGQSI